MSHLIDAYAEDLEREEEGWEPKQSQSKKRKLPKKRERAASPPPAVAVSSASSAAAPAGPVDDGLTLHDYKGQRLTAEEIALLQFYERLAAQAAKAAAKATKPRPAGVGAVGGSASGGVGGWSGGSVGGVSGGGSGGAGGIRPGGRVAGEAKKPPPLGDGLAVQQKKAPVRPPGKSMLDAHNEASSSAASAAAAAGGATLTAAIPKRARVARAPARPADSADSGSSTSVAMDAGTVDGMKHGEKHILPDG